MFIDYAMRHFTDHKMEYDKDGKRRAAALNRLRVLCEAISLLHYPPPKTTGRELFGNDKAIELIRTCTDAGLSPEDTLATSGSITAKAIVNAYHTWGPKEKQGKLNIDEVYMCGGEASNRRIWNCMQQELGSNVRMTMLDVSDVGGEANYDITSAF